MRVLARPLHSAARVPLDTGWQCRPGSVAFGADEPADPFDDRGWLAMSRREALAPALSRQTAWSPAASPRDFDAEAWTFRCRFDRPGPHREWILGLDGLATLARVSLNGEPLLSSANMFRSHEIDLSGRLHATGNELRIQIDPLAAALAERRPRPRWRAPMVAHQQMRWWRTTLLGRTPGWSPAAPVVGPWRPVWLEPSDACRPSQLEMHAERLGERGRLAVGLRLQGGATAASEVRLRLVRDGRQVETLLTLDDSHRWGGTLDVPDVALWWPHTHGEPALYEASLHLRPGAADRAGTEQAISLGRVGFRSLRLERGADGNGFQFVVNDVPIFARGACWTPLDALGLHADAAAYDAALAQVRRAGLNLLRLPGCTMYEDDAFHDACDAHGVLLWQDLMFANMDFPAEEPAFLAEVEAEVAQQAARWQARPSLAVVCGNSEVAQQAAMWGAERSAWAPPLFHEILPARMAALLPGLPYWPSSAWGGAVPFQPDTGTTSYYGVGAYRRELDDARRSGLRFAAECLAFANLPDDDGFARWRQVNPGAPLRAHSPAWKARVPRDLGAGWDFDDVRDHYVERLFGERADLLRATEPDRHVALGRAAVAEAIEAAFARWRAAGSVCGGALVWFLRDLQVGAGWGLLDELGRPKSGFRALSRACQPLHLGVTDDGLNGFTLHLANDGERPRGRHPQPAPVPRRRGACGFREPGLAGPGARHCRHARPAVDRRLR